MHWKECLVTIPRKSRTPAYERASEFGTLAAVVSVRREELDLRQSELADLAGCSTRFVHAVETGKPTVQLDKLLAVLRVLGLHLAVERGQHGDGVTAGAELVALYDLDHGREAPA